MIPMATDSVNTPPAVSEAYPSSHVLLLFMALGLGILGPFFYFGNPPGQDFHTQLSTWMEVARQWEEGTFYPRWSAQANYGFGNLRFIFYPPVSWMLGAGLSLVFPWKWVPGVFVWLAVTLAGFSMFRLARRWMPTHAAAMAGVLYAANPYHLLMIYARSSFAELLAGALLPLLLLEILELPGRGQTSAGRWPATGQRSSAGLSRRRGVLPLALVFAALWLTNVPAAVLCTYSLVFLLVFFAAAGKSAEFALAGVSAMALGLALAAFYVLPAAVEQKWLNLDSLFYTWQFPEQIFLFVGRRDPFMDDVNLVGKAEIGMAAIGVLLSRGERRSLPRVWWALLALALCDVALTLPQSSIVWRTVPKLQGVQFAWRCLLLLGAPMAFFLAAGLARLSSRAAWSCVAALFVFGMAGAFAHQARETMGGQYTVNLERLHEAIEHGNGYEEIDYNPRGYDSSRIPRLSPALAVVESAGTAAGESGQGQPRIQIQSWKAESRNFIVDTPRPLTLAVRLFDYPAWRMEVNGRALEARSRTAGGQTIIAVPAGRSEVRLTFTRTADRTVGGIIAAAAAVLVLILAWAGRRRLS